MNRDNRGTGLPGTQQWDDYFANLARQLSNVGNEVQSLVDDAVQGLEQPTGPFVMTFGNATISASWSPGQNQGAGDVASASAAAATASSSTRGSVPASAASSSRGKRPAAQNSGDGPKEKSCKPNHNKDINVQVRRSSSTSAHSKTTTTTKTLSLSRGHSGNFFANGNSVSWSGKRSLSIQSNGEGRYTISNTGASQFQRETDQNAIQLTMEGMTVRIRPRNGISLDDVRVSFNNRGLLEVYFPNSSNYQETGHRTIGNHTITWNSNRRIQFLSRGNRLFFSNTGNTQFQRQTSAGNLAIMMNGVTVNVQPGNGVSLDDILVTFNDAGVLEIQIPDQ